MTSKRPSRFQLIRSVLVFQFKLALDGLRDVLLSPISLGAAILGIATSRDEPEKYFNRLLEFGRASDKWINLFDAHTEEEGPSSDTLVRHAETMVKAELVRLQEKEKSRKEETQEKPNLQP